jgi:hypothetical protein
MMGYFRQFFNDNPALVETKSNEDLMAKWKHDHPNHSQKDFRKAQQSLANLKSLLRRAVRGGSKGKRGRKPLAGGTKGLGNARMSLESLEVQIDDCIVMAKNLDRDGLSNVINHLRYARNEVVLKIG